MTWLPVRRSDWPRTVKNERWLWPTVGCGIRPAAPYNRLLGDLCGMELPPPWDRQLVAGERLVVNLRGYLTGGLMLLDRAAYGIVPTGPGQLMMIQSPNAPTWMIRHRRPSWRARGSGVVADESSGTRRARRRVVFFAQLHLPGAHLRALGIPHDQVPARVAEQAGLFRSPDHRKRVLLLLDNAATAAQVRQLLPGGGGCMVVATARSRLSGLIGDGADIVAIEPLQQPAATALLRATIGEHRGDDEFTATTELVRQCAGLPLALTVTAARLVAHPRWSVRRVVADLAGEHSRLEGMSMTDDQSVAATLDLSYRALSETAARCYRAIGAHPGRRPGTAVIAAALDLPPDTAARGLAELVEAERFASTGVPPRIHDHGPQPLGLG